MAELPRLAGLRMSGDIVAWTTVGLMGLGVLALIVMGWQSRNKMPAELNPKIDFPYVTVLTTYPGAGPAEIETLVTEPIEKAVASIGNLRNVISSSQDGVSTVLLEFKLGTNLDAVAADVRAHLGDKVYDTVIPRNVRVSEAPSFGRPVMLHDFHCAGSQAYVHLAGEVLRRERAMEARR